MAETPFGTAVEFLSVNEQISRVLVEMQTRKQNQKQRQKHGHQLFNNNPRGRSRVSGIGYGTGERATRSLRKIHTMPKSYRRQVATTMYYRAKHHKYQTPGMRNAMKIYGKYMKSL